MNNTTQQTGCSANALTAAITQHIRELAEETDTARASAAMCRYLDMCAKFHQYSPFNVWLIMMGNPAATLVAGFHRWQGMNRFVRKGEHGIPILAPIVFRAKDEADKDMVVLKGFKVVYVFDVSQTEGEPLPPVPNWKSPEQNAALSERLITYAQSLGISVTVKALPGEIQGASRGGAIELDPSAGTKTIIHEIAHELMHHGEDRPTDATVREMEAESVAYVVGKHFGLEDLASPNYVALHGATSDSITRGSERILMVAAKMINAIESCE